MVWKKYSGCVTIANSCLVQCTGAWCNGSTPAFGAVDLGSNPGAPVFYKLMDNDSRSSHSDQETPDPLKPSRFRRGLYAIAIQGFLILSWLVEPITRLIPAEERAIQRSICNET